MLALGHLCTPHKICPGCAVIRVSVTRKVIELTLHCPFSYRSLPAIVISIRHKDLRVPLGLYGDCLAGHL